MVFCSVCFGDPASPLTQGYNYGVIAMLAITVLLLVVLGGVFMALAKRMNKFKKT